MPVPRFLDTACEGLAVAGGRQRSGDEHNGAESIDGQCVYWDGLGGDGFQVGFVLCGCNWVGQLRLQDNRILN